MTCFFYVFVFFVLYPLCFDFLFLLQIDRENSMACTKVRIRTGAIL